MAVIYRHRMERVVDARGLMCPLPALRARAALVALAPGDVLVVLATDPEAPVDIGALAAEGGHGLRSREGPDGWRFELVKAAQ
jgi:tRNA 2-thiouridine synthesizing protein A